MTSKSKDMVFGAGIPTQPDVMRLKKEIGVPTVGVLIPYAKIGEIIHEDPAAARFRTVVVAWRKTLFRENNVLLRAEPGKGYVAMDAHERIHDSGSRYKNALRGVRKSGIIASTTETESLSDAEKRVRDHIVASAGALAVAAAAQARQIKFPVPTCKSAAA